MRELGYETLFSSFLPLGKLNPVRIWFGDVAAAAGDQSGEKVHKLASAFVRKSAYYFYWNANAQCLKNEQKVLFLV